MTGTETMETEKQKHGHGRRLTEAQKEEIGRLRNAGFSTTEVARRVGCHHSTVQFWGTAKESTAEQERKRARKKRFLDLGRKLDLAAPDYTDPAFLKWLQQKAINIRCSIQYRNGVAEDLITTGWLMEKYLAGKCELSGRAFNFNKHHPCSPDVDRINPDGGYFPENCRVILKTLNIRRHNYNNDDEAMMAAAEDSWFTAGDE